MFRVINDQCRKNMFPVSDFETGAREKKEGGREREGDEKRGWKEITINLRLPIFDFRTGEASTGCSSPSTTSARYFRFLAILFPRTYTRSP